MAKSWDVTVLPDVLNQLYQRVVERGWDPVGLIYWGCVLERGEQSMRDVVRAFGHSQEYQDRFISPFNTRDAVTFCYHHFLARDPDSAGLEYHIGVASQQGFNTVIDAMVDSAEYTNRFGDDGVPG